MILDSFHCPSCNRFFFRLDSYYVLGVTAEISSPPSHARSVQIVYIYCFLYKVIPATGVAGRGNTTPGGFAQLFSYKLCGFTKKGKYFLRKYGSFIDDITFV